MGVFEEESSGSSLPGVLEEPARQGKPEGDSCPVQASGWTVALLSPRVGPGF